jgi:hypothetical protein
MTQLLHRCRIDACINMMEKPWIKPKMNQHIYKINKEIRILVNWWFINLV